MKHDCQETELLISGYLDGELTQSDRQRVDLILEDCRQCTETHQEMKKFREGVGDIPFDKLTKKEKMTVNKYVTTNTWANVGQLIIPLLLLYGTGAFLMVAGVIKDTEAPLWLKIGLPSIICGLGLMVFTVLVQRIKAHKTDKYKDVQI
jgi:hypothetical protein